MAAPETTTPTPAEISAPLRDQPETQRDVPMAAARLNQQRSDIRATLVVADDLACLLAVAEEC